MLKPLNGKAIAIVQKNTKSESGIIINESNEVDSLVATIYSISKCYDKAGKIENVEIKENDKVIISRFSGNKIEYEGKEYLVIDIENILAVIKEEG